MRKYIFSLLVLAIFLMSSHSALATYNATSVLGQNNIFTTANANHTSVDALGLNSDQDSVVDTVNHRLFISDGLNNRVLVYNLDSNNNLIGHSADFVLGQVDFTHNAVNINGTPGQNTLNTPLGLVYDGVNNRLFVSDAGNTRV